MRKTKVYTVQTGNPEYRDENKSFLIREMSAINAQRWAVSAFLALHRAGVDFKGQEEGVEEAGMAGFVSMGFEALFQLEENDYESLTSRLRKCVEYLPNANMRTTARPLKEDNADPDHDDIQEVQTLLNIYSEVIELHTGFSASGVLTKFLNQKKTSSSPGQTQDNPSMSTD